ncbi:MAG TPA: hypothetical protein VFW33_19680 [Gemmataceae bacterium]|nr:hypothetical protein [Gemmataceae bacterium]
MRLDAFDTLTLIGIVLISFGLGRLITRKGFPFELAAIILVASGALDACALSDDVRSSDPHQIAEWILNLVISFVAILLLSFVGLLLGVRGGSRVTDRLELHLRPIAPYEEPHRLVGQVCGSCRGVIEDVAGASACEACGAVMHRQCWRPGDGRKGSRNCTRCGCALPPGPRPVTPQAPGGGDADLAQKLA